MSDPPSDSPEDEGAPHRPGALTAAAVLMFVLGILSVLAGLILVLFGGGSHSLRNAGVLTVVIVLGALFVFAASRILRLRRSGLTLGVALSLVALISSLVAFTQRPTSGIVDLAIAAFLLWALIAHRSAFRA